VLRNVQRAVGRSEMLHAARKRGGEGRGRVGCAGRVARSMPKRPRTSAQFCIVVQRLRVLKKNKWQARSVAAEGSRVREVGMRRQRRVSWRRWEVGWRRINAKCPTKWHKGKGRQCRNGK